MQSRCRIYSLGRHFGLGLVSFRTRKLSAVDQAAASLIVTAEPVQGLPVAVPHLCLPRDGAELQRFMERLAGATAGPGPCETSRAV